MKTILNWLKKSWPWLALAGIVLAGGWFASYRLAEPAWEMNHQGYILSEWPHNAANFLRFGLPATRTGLAMDYGWIRPEQGLAFRVDHPPITSWLIAVSYLLLGIHEWSARLVPLLLSLGLVVLVFIFVRQVGGGSWAILAAAFAALNPGLLYYARLPVPHVPAVFFSLLVFVLYRAWLENDDRHCLAALWAAFVLAAWTDWVAYFVMPWIIFHYVLFHFRRRRNLTFVWVSLVLPLACFASHIGWAYAVAGKASLIKLMDIYQFRSSAATKSGGFTGGEFYGMMYAKSRLYLTSILGALSAVWAASLVFRVFKRRPMADAFLVLALFLFGMTHNLMFRNRVYIHDFAMTFQWIPFVAISGAFGVRLLAQASPIRWRRATGAVVVVLALVGFAWQAADGVTEVQADRIEPSLYLVGRRVDEIAPKEARIMCSTVPDIRLAYYMDRPFDIVRTVEIFDAKLKADAGYSHYVLGPGDGVVDEGLHRRLAEAFPVQNIGDYAVFDLKGRQGSPAIQDGAAPVPNPTRVQFGDSIVLVGYEIKPVGVPSQETPIQVRLREHFNAHPDLMPGSGPQFRVVFYWQCLKATGTDLVVNAVLETAYGDALLLGDGHRLGGAAYPVPLWREGDVVREEYEVGAPVDLSPLRFDLRVSVRESGAGPFLKPLGSRVRGDGAILGSVDVLPRESLVGLAAAPAMSEHLTADLGDNLELQGYSLSGGGPGGTAAAGQSLRVETAWLCRGVVSSDRPAWVELASGKARVRALLGVEPTRLWQAGRYYVRRGELALSPYLLPGRYVLSLTMGEGLPRARLGEVEVNWGRGERWVVSQVGLPNGTSDDARVVDTDRALKVKFELDEPKSLEVVAGWTGEALCVETRVEVHLANAAGERYLGTWVVPRGRYTVERLSIPRSVTAAGENTVRLQVAASQSKPHYVGWRAWVDAVLPDLLYDTSGPYDGWIRAEFAEVNAGAWRPEWSAYLDLARGYTAWGMDREVARAFSAAWQAGLRPQWVEDLNVFLPAAQTEAGLATGIQAALQAVVPHGASVNLGDRVEYLGYGLNRLDDGRGKLALYFRALSKMEADYTVWLHQSAESNPERSLALDHSLGTSGWKPGEVHEDSKIVTLEPGKVRFVFGLWRGDDASRLQAAGQSGQHEIDLGWLEPDR